MVIPHIRFPLILPSDSYSGLDCWVLWISEHVRQATNSLISYISHHRRQAQVPASQKALPPASKPGKWFDAVRSEKGIGSSWFGGQSRSIDRKALCMYCNIKKSDKIIDKDVVCHGSGPAAYVL